MQKRSVIVASAVLLLLAVLGFVGFRWMQSDALATLVDFSGRPERDTAASIEQWREAAQGDEFHDGEGARTAPNSEAHFRLLGGARMRLNPASQVRFQRHQTHGTLRVDIALGSAEVQSGSGSVTIGSEFGDLVLDAGSTITLTRQGGQLDVDVELGGIQLSERRVQAGDRVVLELGGLIVDVAAPEPTASAPSPPPSAMVDSTPQAELQLDRGDGVSDFDVRVKAGDSFVVHDPAPPTAIGFDVSQLCDGPAQVRAGSLRTEAAGQANLRFDRGTHRYEVRCLETPEQVAASGSVRVLHDSGTRVLPTFTPSANIVTDGRQYTVLYQYRLPRVSVSWPTAPEADSYTLSIDGRSIKTKSPRHTFASLGRGKHTLVFRAATTPARQSRTTTIDVSYDTQAPAARVSEPSLGFAPGASVEISGQAMPGWEVSVDGKAIDVDPDNKFSVQTTGDKPIPIAFSHGSRGTHYYIRRPKPEP